MITIQRSLIVVCIFFLVCAAFQSHDVNKHIEAINEENKYNSRKPLLPVASYYSLIFSAILLSAVLIIDLVRSIR